MTGDKPPGRTAVIFGATGAVGGHCLDELLASERYDRVIAIGRRPTGRTNAKLSEFTIALDQLHALPATEVGAIDDAFCCLGTTIAAAGSQDAFRQVDCELPRLAARFAKAQGARQFLLVTALGADPRSAVFYNRVKGDAEAAVIAEGVDSVAIFRPSLLLADRAEFRWKEKVSEPLLKALSVLMIGPARKFRPVSAATVARAMVRVAVAPKPGTTIYLSYRIADVGRV